MNFETSSRGFLNDGSHGPPRLEIYLNLGTLKDLPANSVCGGLSDEERMGRLKQDGFQGVQVEHADPLSFEAVLPHCGLNRVSHPGEADEVFRRHVDRGDRCLTLHVGWGLETDADADRLVEAVLTASTRHGLPAFIETHRATMTQDVWRTVQLAQRFPEIRFNADFSHYYAGQEMEYGDFEARLDFMQPIFDRTGFMHGRIASRGCIQAPIESMDQRPLHAVGMQGDYLQSFISLWTRAMAGFRRHAGPGDILIFAPELLSAEYDYARLVPDAAGKLVEATDRYAEALLYRDLALQCYPSDVIADQTKPETR